MQPPELMNVFIDTRFHGDLVSFGSPPAYGAILPHPGKKSFKQKNEKMAAHSLTPTAPVYGE